jgi:hypothetical protein
MGSLSRLSGRLLLLAALATSLPFAACASNAQPPGRATDYCGSSDPCGCVESVVGQTCSAHGTTCSCTGTNAEDAGFDAGDAADALPAPGSSVFIGKWSPISGSGQANCGGQLTPLPPNTGAILTFTQDGPSALSATSSGAGDCALALSVSGAMASLAQSPEVCAVAAGGSVSFTAFTLVFTPGVGTTDAGATGAGLTPDASDAGGRGDASDAASGPDDAGANDDASVDGGPPSLDAGADGATSSEDASDTNDAASSDDAGTDGSSPSSNADAGPARAEDTLDWQLADSDGTCVTTLHYTLVRAP